MSEGIRIVPRIEMNLGTVGSPVSVWEFEGNLLDSVGGHDFAVAVGSAAYGSGLNGRAIDFGGNVVKLEGPIVAEHEAGSANDLTIFWKIRATAWPSPALQVLAKGFTLSSTAGWTTFVDGLGRINASVSDGSTNFSVQSGSVVPIDGRWVSCVFVIDRTADEARLYVNGVLVDTVDISTCGDATNSSRAIFMGDESGAQAVPWKVDQAGIENAAWTLAQARAYHARGSYGGDLFAGFDFTAAYELEDNGDDMLGSADLTPVNSPSYADGGAFGKYVQLTEVTDRTDSPHFSLAAASAGDFDPGLDSFVVASWVYFDTLENQSLFTKGNTFGGNDGWILNTSAPSGTQARFRVESGATNVQLLGTTTLQTARWYHFAAVVDRDADEARLYVDGALEDSADISTLGTIVSAQDLYLGARFDGFCMKGRLDRVFYGRGRAWSLAEVQEHRANGFLDPSGVSMGWSDVSDDVISKITAEWGVHGSSPDDRLAEPGSLAFDLDNSAENSGGVRGYYSPDNANLRSGFRIGTPVRLMLRTDVLGDLVKWVGTIEDVRPRPGVRRPVTSVRCVDWLGDAQRAKLQGLTVETDVQSDELFETLVSAVPRAPYAGTRVGSGSDIYPFALDNVQDESSRVYGELGKLALSEYGFIFVQAGEVVFEGRRRRSGGGNPQYALDEDDQILKLGVVQGRDEIMNRVQVTVHPRKRDAAATSVLFTLGGAVEIPRNTSVTINCPYSDPSQLSQRVGGVDMVTPVATTDYQFNTAEDGTGTDITAQLSVAATFGGNSAKLVLSNNGPADGFIPAGDLQLRGRGLYDFEPVISDQEDAASLALYGENSFGYDMPHQSSPQNAVDLAIFILDQFKDPTTRIETVEFLANWDEQAAAAALTLEVSEQCSVTAPTLGLEAEPYFINGFKYEISQSGLVMVTWDLGPVDLSQYWILEVTGRTELDLTTRLGYGLFVSGWTLDTSQLGVNTFLN